MSAAVADLLRDKEVDRHSCLQPGFENYCGLSPSHPATSGQVMYNFFDPDLNLEGHSVQTLIGGICLDDACNTMTSVAFHEDGCSYTVNVEDRQLSNISSLVDALMTVEKVTEESIQRTSKAFRYGVVHRNDQREWLAFGYREVRECRGCEGFFCCFSPVYFKLALSLLRCDGVLTLLF